jgi:DNA-binding CsgD family transcriptional regulator
MHAERPLAAAWRALVEGSDHVVEITASAETSTMTMARQRGSSRALPLPPRGEYAMRRFLLEGRQKHIAIDMGVSCGSLTCLLKRSLGLLGVDCLPSQVPLVLTIAAAEAAATKSDCNVLVTTQTLDDIEYRTFTVASPDAWLAERLPRCQARVAALRTWALSHAQIARMCSSSPRTVANQLAMIARRLNVATRAELLALLAREYLAGAMGTPSLLRSP